MRTSRMLGVVCAGWIALAMGAPHAGATTPGSAGNTSGRNTEPITWISSAGPPNIPLLSDWLGNQGDRNGNQQQSGYVNRNGDQGNQQGGYGNQKGDQGNQQGGYGNQQGGQGNQQG